MPNEELEQKTTKWDLLRALNANATLAGAKFLVLVPTQPLQVLMRHRQARLNAPFIPPNGLPKREPEALSIPKAYKEIRMNPSIKSFFKGLKPGLFKEVGKSITYKGTLIKDAPDLSHSILFKLFGDFYEKMAPTSKHLTTNIFAGVIAGFSDAALGGPIDRWSTFDATAHGTHSNLTFLDMLKAKRGLMRQLGVCYDGFIPATIKGTLAFSTFFSLSQPIQKLTANFYGLSPKNSVWYCTGTSAVISGFAVGIVSAFPDVLKTQAQMASKAEKIPLVTAFKINFQKHGIKCITVGLPEKMFLITMGWALVSLVMQTLNSNQDAPERERKPRIH